MPGPRSQKVDVIPYGLHQERWANENYPNGPSAQIWGQGYAWQDLEITDGHKVSQLGKTTGNIGGTFQVTKRDYAEAASNNGVMQFYTGTATAKLYKQFAATNVVSGSNFPTVTSTSCSELGAIATKIIANVIPTNPLAGAATALGEAREGIPSLVGTDFFRGRASLARSAGSEYLNATFGWLPLVNDLKKFVRSVKEQDALIKKYEANSGKRLKRRVELPVENTTVEYKETNTVPSPGFTGSYAAAAYDGLGYKLVTETTSRRIWFSGCFTYYLPPYNGNDSNLKRNEQLSNHLYGTRFTPEVLWDLAPWTWAADWYANTGDVIHNVSAFAADGLVMPYAYIMETKSKRKRLDAFQKYRTYGQRQYMQSFTTTVKKRCGASPYGFGVTFDSLTPRQIATITALGMTKSGTQYRDF